MYLDDEYDPDEYDPDESDPDDYEDENPSGDPDRDELDQRIAQIPDQDLRGLVRDLAEQNADLRDRIVSRYGSQTEEAQFQQRKNALDRFEARHTRGVRILEPAEDYASQLTDFLDSRVDPLLRSGSYRAALRMTTRVYETAAKHFRVDRDGELCDVADACVERWDSIRKRAPEALRFELADWLEEASLEDDCGTGASEVLLTFLGDLGDDRSILEHRMERVDRELRRLTALGERCTESQEKDFAGAVTLKLELLEEMENPQEERDAFYRDYWTLYPVRSACVENLIGRNRLDEAVEVLLACKKLDQDNPKNLRADSERLIDLYQKLGREEDCRAELLTDLFTYGRVNLDRLLQLKALCTPEEWSDYREKVLSDRKHARIWYPLMEADGQYQRLLESISQRGSLAEMDRYAAQLRTRFPEEVRDFYVAYIDRAIQSASNRREYANAIKLLRKLEKFSVGRKAAQALVADWKVQYAKKSAMMDELRKAGY